MAFSIQSRAEFFDVLDRTLDDARRRLAATPRLPAYQSLVAQLEAMKAWTANGREPTPDERGKIRIGLLAIRELDPEPEGEEAAFIDALHALNGYFRRWPDDPAAASDPGAS